MFRGVIDATLWDAHDAAGIACPSAEELKRMTYDETIALAKKVKAGSASQKGRFGAF